MRSIIERESFSQRLRSKLAEIGDDGSSPSRLAREFNRRYPGTPITMYAARRWLLGEAIPAQEKLRVLAEWLNVSTEWLRYGETADIGATEVAGQAVAVAYDYSLMRAISSLSSTHQQVVRDLVKSLQLAEEQATKNHADEKSRS